MGMQRLGKFASDPFFVLFFDQEELRARLLITVYDGVTSGRSR
jgi:hypothetical protein